MHARVVLGVGKGVLFREVSSFRNACKSGTVLFRQVSSVQGCPYREVPLQVLSVCVCTDLYDVDVGEVWRGERSQGCHQWSVCEWQPSRDVVLRPPHQMLRYQGLCVSVCVSVCVCECEGVCECAFQ